MKKRLLFVWPSAEFSIWDVARGYRNALERTGRYDIRDYRLYARMKYHATAMGKRGEDIGLLARVASENIVVEALKHRAERVLIISGMAFHPDSVFLLRRLGIETHVLFTESPYNDEQQRAFHAVYPAMRCLTNERISATNGWDYVAHAYDPEIHKPVQMIKRYDVLLIGTLWKERIELLNAVDWTGITLGLIGSWVGPPFPEDATIGKFYEEGCIQNKDAPGYYGAARICLNPHRAHPTAESLNPRAYELAACGAFQLSDYRAELPDVFGRNGSAAVASFDGTALDLGEKIRYWLRHDDERDGMVHEARSCVAPHTFDTRLTRLMADF